jgi:hypothetical protein
MGAEQLLSAAGHGDAAIHEAVDAIVKAAEATVGTRQAQQAPEPPTGEPEPEAEPVAPEPHDEPAPEPVAADDEHPAESSEGGGAGEDESPAPS